MTSRIVERLRAVLALAGYALLGAAAPWLIFVGADLTNGDGIGVILAIAAGISAAVALNFCSRRFIVHLGGAAAAWAGWTVSGGVIICQIFGCCHTDLSDSMLLAGWIGLWTALPCALLINSVTAVIMHHARPRAVSLIRCDRCAYDLRGLPHERCPECGTICHRIPAPPPAARRS